VYIPRMMSNPTEFGPRNGSLVIVGGGSLADPSILKRFITLAGGPNARIVVVPTAQETDDPPPSFAAFADLIAAGALNLALLHTRDRDVANSAEFARPLESAGGVWFSGGRQWRLADAYLHTKTQEAFGAVLERGGVLGGSSAGATILGSYLVRGDTAGNELMMGDHQEGFGFLRNVAIDQHLLKRNRQFDLIEVIEARPELLGIGLDESTAILVRGDRFEVIGRSYVAIYDAAHELRPGSRFYLLAPGDRFDLTTREATRPAQTFERLRPLATAEEPPVQAPESA
jgi:cyanophycinase